MDETQHFRLAGTTAVEMIDYDHMDGHDVIYWEDIELAFPGVKHVKCNGVIVKPLRDSDHKRIVPHCIKYHPNVVLDVVVSSSDVNTSADVGRTMDATSASTMEAVVESLQMPQLAENVPSGDRLSALTRSSTLPSMGTPFNLKRRLTFKQIAAIARKDSVESKVEQMLVSSLPSELQVQVRASNNVRESLIQAVKNGQVNQSNEQLIACLQELGVNVMEIKNMASMIMDLVSKNYKLTSENNDLLTRVNEMQDEIKVLQIQALDRLVFLQKSVQSLLTQTYELHEYPIPRLFIILPQDTSSWNPLDLLSNKVRLYFLCECGEHTKSINTKVPHHIHLAKHDGYELARPNEFFQRYGRYVLTILQMFKYGITVAGVAVPALTQLIRPDDVDKVTNSLKFLTNTLEPGVNQVIDYIDKLSTYQGLVVDGLTEQMDGNEALEGADLRQLELFLKNKDEHRVLGNLYRTVTTEGHVKWVCIDHYRENYHEMTAKVFSDAITVLGGTFEENIGRVEVTLSSKAQADQFYQALGRARSVHELKLGLHWETTQGDFKRLRNALPKTGVGVLELHLWYTDGPISDRLNRNQRYDPIIDIMRHPSIHSFTIKGPRNFSIRSSLLSRDDDFPNLRHLGVFLSQWRSDMRGLNCLIAKSSNLSSLALRSGLMLAFSLREGFDALAFPPTLRHLDIPLYQWRNDIPSTAYFISKALDLGLTVGTGLLGNDNHYFLEAYNAVAGHRTPSLAFKDWDLCIPPPPPGKSDQKMTTHQYEHLLKVYWQYSNRELDVKNLDEPIADTIAKAMHNSLIFTKLYLGQESQLGDSLVNNISSIVSKSKLSFIKIYTKYDEGRVRILDSIQWKHLRTLWIYLESGTFETSIMRALVNGVKKMSERVEIEWFRFYTETDGLLIPPEGDLLQAFVASTSVEKLELKVDMTVEQILSLLRSADFSRLERLELRTEGFDPVKVDAILDGLNSFLHVTKLKSLHLVQASITDEQKSRMEMKGILLSRTIL
ncbi:hypothetical protein BGX34_003163 [Mortierella sp. NVP85]|nr:hypothetical protein BGX34_003163 [Mortierella sp. NVP85]